MTYVLRLTRDGVDVVEPVPIPREDYDRLKTWRAGYVDIRSRTRTRAISIDITTPGPVYRLEIRKP